MIDVKTTIKQSLAESIANFGYPVGMGLPPPDEALDKMTVALLAALGDTHVVVPREPTEAMRSAGANWTNYDHVENPDMSDVDKFVAQRVYGAMIDAADTSPDRGGDNG